MSNTKLTKDQKIERRDMLDALSANADIVQSEDKRVTLIWEESFPGSNMLNCAVSYASPDEIKPRRKVGDYHALVRWYEMETFQIPSRINPWDFVEYLAANY